MKRFVNVQKLIVMTTLCLILSYPVLSQSTTAVSPTAYQLVSEKYGFSVTFPATPTEQPSVNDGGPPSTFWHGIKGQDIYLASVTSYKDKLNPDQVLTTSALPRGAFKINAKPQRFTLRAKGGRLVDAMALTAIKIDNENTVMYSLYVVDENKLLSFTAILTNKIREGEASAYVTSLRLLR
jgi:hypothetical protein